MVDAEESALGGIVHGAVAAGFGDTNIFDGAVAIDGEGDGGLGPTGSANGGVDGALHPILADGATNGFDVPGIASGEITAALALNGYTTIERAGRVRIAAGNIHLAALAIRDGILGWRSIFFEDLGGFAGRKRLFFFKFGDFGGVGFGLRFLGLGLFLMETFGGINGLALCGVGGRGHGDASTGDEINPHTGITTTNTAPGITRALDPDTDEHEDGEGDVKEDRVGEAAFEGCGVESVGHGGRFACY